MRAITGFLFLFGGPAVHADTDSLEGRRAAPLEVVMRADFETAQAIYREDRDWLKKIKAKYEEAVERYDDAKENVCDAPPSLAPMKLCAEKVTFDTIANQAETARETFRRMEDVYFNELIKLCRERDFFVPELLCEEAASLVRARREYETANAKYNMSEQRYDDAYSHNYNCDENCRSFRKAERAAERALEKAEDDLFKADDKYYNTKDEFDTAVLVHNEIMLDSCREGEGTLKPFCQIIAEFKSARTEKSLAQEAQLRAANRYRDERVQYFYRVEAFNLCSTLSPRPDFCELETAMKSAEEDYLLALEDFYKSEEAFFEALLRREQEAMATP